MVHQDEGTIEYQQKGTIEYRQQKGTIVYHQ